MSAYKKLLTYSFAILIILVALPSFYSLNLEGINYSSDKLSINDETPNQFPFVGQTMVYDVVQTAAGVQGAFGKLTVEYDSMVNDTVIHGNFYVDVISVIEYYNECADGSENLVNRHLIINADGTYLIYLFMKYFFNWTGPIVPTPMWIQPDEIAIGASVQFWNYTVNCYESHSIALMEKYYEVFIFRVRGPWLDMTLMYSQASHGESGLYGMLVYMSGIYEHPSISSKLQATFKLVETNATLHPLRELNRSIIMSTAISFYSVVIVGAFVFRIKTRKDLIGGEV